MVSLTGTSAGPSHRNKADGGDVTLCHRGPGGDISLATAFSILTTNKQSSKIFYESESEVAQSCPTLCDPMGCSLSGSSVHGIFQARVLELIAISFSRGSSRPRNRTRVSCIAGRCFTVWATREASRILIFYRGCHFEFSMVKGKCPRVCDQKEYFVFSFAVF